MSRRHLLALAAAALMPAAAHAQAPHVEVTVLSTMLAGDPGRGIGEWGFAALVEYGDRRWLVDAGARPETVLRNAAELGIDLSQVTDVILTHHHGDHTGGLVTLRRELRARHPDALSRVHVARGFFWERVREPGRPDGVAAMRAEYEALGGTFIEHAAAEPLSAGAWFTGPVPRVHPERNWSGNGVVLTPTGRAEDTVPEDAALVLDGPDGLVVITGCGHAGVVNIVTHARAIRPGQRVDAVIGGLHLFAASDAQLAWTARQLRPTGIRHLLGAHCTGIEAVHRLRQALRLRRGAAVVGAVGARFRSGRGITPLALAS